MGQCSELPKPALIHRSLGLKDPVTRKDHAPHINGALAEMVAFSSRLSGPASLRNHRPGGQARQAAGRGRRPVSPGGAPLGTSASRPAAPAGGAPRPASRLALPRANGPAPGRLPCLTRPRSPLGGPAGGQRGSPSPGTYLRGPAALRARLLLRGRRPPPPAAPGTWPGAAPTPRRVGPAAGQFRAALRPSSARPGGARRQSRRRGTPRSPPAGLGARRGLGRRGLAGRRHAGPGRAAPLRPVPGGGPDPLGLPPRPAEDGRKGGIGSDSQRPGAPSARPARGKKLPTDRMVVAEGLGDFANLRHQ
ncbi:uncharacterized protein [Manis javanica]|uniref:uncharacterized protein n=1 Tax=Manis javanica TaxID=9974 RepID=UPI003C6D4D84